MPLLRILFFAIAVIFASFQAVSANEIINRDEDLVNGLAAAFEAYAASNHVYPYGTNAEILAQLKDPVKGVRWSRKADESGVIASDSGVPVVFLFSTDGWVIIAVPNKAKTALWHQAVLRPLKSITPNQL